jgi:hypothetical protein
MNELPFVVEARLKTPLSAKAPLHLDGLLLAARDRCELPDPARPLACVAMRDGIYRASAGVIVADGPGGVSHENVKRIKRIDSLGGDASLIRIDENSPRSQRLIDAMSPYRQRLSTYPLIVGARAVYWQAVGDADGVRELLEFLPTVGAMSSQVYGEVDEWSVHGCEADAKEGGWFAAGRILRTLPIALATTRYGFDLSEGTLVIEARVGPPYWVADGTVEAVMPSLRSLVMNASGARQLLSVV